jgi:hypothetical protein
MKALIPARRNRVSRLLSRYAVKIQSIRISRVPIKMERACDKYLQQEINMAAAVVAAAAIRIRKTI